MTTTEAAELPFVRSSERGDFKQCPRKWYWRYVERLVPTTVKVGARDFGTGIHLAMAEYYVPEPNISYTQSVEKRRGRPMLETWEEWCKETRNYATKDEKSRKQFNEEEFNEMVEMGRYLLGEHMRVYCGDPQWQVIAREETFAATIANAAVNVGTIDLVVRDLSTGYVWIVDHKTAGQFPGESSYNLDDQGGSYSSIATTILRHKNLIGPQERVRGIIYNVLRKGKRDERPRNPEGLYTNKPKKTHYVAQLTERAREDVWDEGEVAKAEYIKRLPSHSIDWMIQEAEELGMTVYGEPSKIQPQPNLKRYTVERTAKQQRRQLQRVVDDVQAMTAVRIGTLPILKAPGKLCGWCDFFQLCQLEEDLGDTEGMKEALFRRLDPYHDHRQGAANSKLSVAADKDLKHVPQGGA